MWFEYLRIITECRPKMVLIENVAALRSRGLDVVVQGLFDAGYGCWWDCVPALAVGAPHQRDRIWITAVPLEDMPLLHAWRETTEMTRAGCRDADGLYEMRPQATIKMCKAAAGAVKQPDGTTWLTALDSPLFPTPSASSYGSNRGGAAGRVGPIRHSLPSMARSGEWPRLWPTPERSDGSGGRVSAELGGTRPSGAKRAVTLGSAVAHEGRLWPTATAHPRTHTPRPVHHGMQLANEVEHEEQRMWPMPSAADGTGGPGRSPARTGGDNLRTAVAMDEPILWPTPRKGDGERGGRGDLIQVVRGNKTQSTHGGQPGTATRSSGGALNSDWCEWLLGLPIGWTDPDCAEPVHLDWLSEHGLPRTARDVPHRKQRLCAIGNSLVWRVALQRLILAHELLDQP